MQQWSTPGTSEPSVGACADWSAQLQWVTQRFHPDAVEVQLGFWEVQNRLWSGSYVNLGDPRYAAFIEGNLQQALDIVHAGEAEVILNTTSYFGVGTPNWIVDAFDTIVGNVAGLNPSFVSVLDMKQLLCPGGTYSQEVGGLQARTPDNVHFTVPGVQGVIDPMLDPMAASLAAITYAGNA